MRVETGVESLPREPQSRLSDERQNQKLPAITLLRRPTVFTAISSATVATHYCERELIQKYVHLSTSLY